MNEQARIWNVVDICEKFQQFKPVPEDYVTAGDYDALQLRLAEVVAKCDNKSETIALDTMRFVDCTKRIKELAPDATSLENGIERVQKQLAEVTRELTKWQQPFDPVQFQLAKEQASHKDSLAAQYVYIVALEHALKHLQAQLASREATIKELRDGA